MASKNFSLALSFPVVYNLPLCMYQGATPRFNCVISGNFSSDQNQVRVCKYLQSKRIPVGIKYSVLMEKNWYEKNETMKHKGYRCMLQDRIYSTSSRGQRYIGGQKGNGPSFFSEIYNALK